MNYLEYLAGEGFKFFKCKRDKSPMVFWQNHENHIDSKEASYLKNRGYYIGANPPQGIIIIDVDNGAEHVDFAETLTVKTPSGGYHYYYYTDLPLSNNSSVYWKNIDIRTHKGYVIAPGCGNYTVIKKMEIQKLPSDIHNHLYNKLQEKKVNPGIKKGDMPLSELKEYLAKLDPRNFSDQNAWLELMMSSISACGDTEDVHDLLESWSRKDPNYEHDNSIRTRIESIDMDGGITKGTLFHILKKHGIKKKRGIMRSLTDLGNVERVLDYARNNIIIISGAGNNNFAYIWDGKKWVEDQTDRHRYLVAKWLQESLTAEENQWTDKEQFQKFKTRCQNNSTIKNCLSLLSIHPDISKEISIFDADNTILNCASGIIDLRTGELMPHDPKRYCRHMSPIEYKKLDTMNPTANKDRQQYEFFRFVDRIMEDDHDKIQFLRHYLGYCLTGNNDEEIFTMFVGGGQNGKGTLLGCLSHIMGDYYKTTPTKTFMDVKNGKGVGDDLYHLMGSRLVVAEETRSGDKLDLEIIKGITGGDPIPCRPLYGKYTEYRATYKIVISTNHKPMLRETDNSIKRRLRLVKFNYTVPDNERDNTLKNRLPREEGNVILNWLVSGCMDYFNYGVYKSDQIDTDSMDYLESEDILGDFLEACLVESEEDKKGTEIYEVYAVWAEETHERKLTKKMLFKNLEERGYKRKRKNDGTYFCDVDFTGKGLGYLDKYENQKISYMTG